MRAVYQEEGSEDVEDGEENHKHQVHHVWWPTLAFLGVMVNGEHKDWMGRENKLTSSGFFSLLGILGKAAGRIGNSQQGPNLWDLLCVVTLVTVYGSDDIFYQMTRCPWLMDIIINPMSIFLYWQDKKFQWRELQSSDYSNSSTSLQLEPPWCFYNSNSKIAEICPWGLYNKHSITAEICSKTLNPD